MKILEGFIQIHRKMIDSVVFQNPYYLKLWMWLLIKASHKERQQPVGTTIVNLKVGQLIWGRIEAANELNRGLRGKEKKSESTWENYLKKLEEVGKVNREVNSKFTVVTIANYEFYQNIQDRTSQQSSHYSSQQVNSTLTPSYQQVNTNNNVIITSSSTSSNNLNKYKLNAHDAYQQIFSVESALISQSIENWISDFDGNEDIVVYALSETEKAQASNFKYTERIMKNWLSKGIKTVEQAKTAQAAFDKRKQFEIEKKESANEKLYGSPDEPKPTIQVPMHDWVRKGEFT